MRPSWKFAEAPWWAPGPCLRNTARELYSTLRSKTNVFFSFVELKYESESPRLTTVTALNLISVWPEVPHLVLSVTAIIKGLTLFCLQLTGTRLWGLEVCSWQDQTLTHWPQFIYSDLLSLSLADRCNVSPNVFHCVRMKLPSGLVFITPDLTLMTSQFNDFNRTYHSQTNECPENPTEKLTIFNKAL